MSRGQHTSRRKLERVLFPKHPKIYRAVQNRLSYRVFRFQL